MEPPQAGEAQPAGGAAREDLQQRADAANAVLDKGLKELQELVGEVPPGSSVATAAKPGLVRRRRSWLPAWSPPQIAAADACRCLLTPLTVLLCYASSVSGASASPRPRMLQPACPASQDQAGHSVTMFHLMTRSQSLPYNGPSPQALRASALPPHQHRGMPAAMPTPAPPALCWGQTPLGWSRARCRWTMLNEASGAGGRLACSGSWCRLPLLRDASWRGWVHRPLQK